MAPIKCQLFSFCLCVPDLTISLQWYRCRYFPVAGSRGAALKADRVDLHYAHGRSIAKRWRLNCHLRVRGRLRCLTVCLT
jgi:hypothetical protein